MKITQVRAIPMSDPVPVERQHRTDLGTKVKSDATLILVETDKGLRGMGAALGNPRVVQAIVEHELAPEVVGEDPLYSERIYEKMYNGSRAPPALERGVPQPEVSRRSGMVMEAIAGVDIAVWDVKAQALGIPVYQALGAARDVVRAYASGGWAPGDEAEAELGGYAAKGFSAVKMRVVGRDGFSIEKCVKRVEAARRGIGPQVELMVDAHGSLEVPVAINLAAALASGLLEKSLKGGLIVVGALNLGGSLDPIHNAVSLAELAVASGMYFGYYMGIAAMSPFLSLYYQRAGLSAPQIGISPPQVMSSVGQMRLISSG